MLRFRAGSVDLRLAHQPHFTLEENTPRRADLDDFANSYFAGTRAVAPRGNAFRDSKSFRLAKLAEAGWR